MASECPRVLRPLGRAELVSARVFDALFQRDLDPHVAVEPIELDPWLDEILGDPGSPLDPARAVARLRDATRDVEFLCPDHHCIAFAPLLTWIRNRGGLPVRLLLIAHSPGGFLVEWALLRPLLRPGDRIVAPSASARDLIEWLCPELSPYVRVVPHPIRPLPAPPEPRAPEHLLSLGRLVPSKLVHRQLEALRILHDRGHGSLRLVVAGPRTEPGVDRISDYCRGLEVAAHRLGLADAVEFPGVVEDEAEKAALLHRAHVLINLSVSAEESFGKSIVEASGLGVPVITTRWNGLPEALGEAGEALPVRARSLGMDVDASVLADAIERVLRAPLAPERCREAARRFHPELVAPRYRAMLDEALAERDAAGPVRVDDGPALAEPAVPSAGLLAGDALLGRFSWHELLEAQDDELRRLRHAWAPPDRGAPARGTQLRSCLFLGSRSAIEHALAGLPTAAWTERTGATDPVHERRATEPAMDDFAARVAAAAAGPGTRSVRVNCLNLLATMGHRQALRTGIDRLRAEGLRSPGLEFLDAECCLMEGEPERALELGLRVDDPELWSEQASHRLVQLGRAAVAAGRPERVLPKLRAWTERFPDAPGAGAVWLHRCLAALQDGARDEAATAFRRMRALVGERPDLAPLARVLGEADMEA
jgi:glycosyltransferase involved in cell wall biosynthesis